MLQLLPPTIPGCQQLWHVLSQSYQTSCCMCGHDRHFEGLFADMMINPTSVWCRNLLYPPPTNDIRPEWYSLILLTAQ